jgi:hypothetical protein
MLPVTVRRVQETVDCAVSISTKSKHGG